jgi:hypothetical protein
MKDIKNREKSWKETEKERLWEKKRAWRLFTQMMPEKGRCVHSKPMLSITKDYEM